MLHNESRNRRVLFLALNGESFSSIAIKENRGVVTIRSACLREFKKTAPELWKEGIEAGWNGSYRTPSIAWMRQNKDRILSVPPILNQSRKERNAIKLLESLGYKISDPTLKV